MKIKINSYPIFYYAEIKLLVAIVAKDQLQINYNLVFKIL